MKYKLLFLILGRTNVGKSLFFRSLTGQNILSAPVENTTIDYHKGICLDNKDICIIDTAGVTDKNIENVFQCKEFNSIDGILFFIDAQIGITSEDLRILQEIRKSNKDVYLVCNKCDNSQQLMDAYRVGCKKIYFISAKRNVGIKAMLTELSSIESKNINDQNLCNEAEMEDKPNPKCAIIGRTNAGKSTLFNAILGYQRSQTSELTHTTRDPVTERYEFKDVNFELIDTAGFSRNKYFHDYAKSWYAMAQRSIESCDIAILVIDGTEDVIHYQDIKLFHEAIDHYKPIIVLINKIDLIEGFKISHYERYFDHYVKPIIFGVSAVKNKNVKKILSECIKIINIASLKIPRAKLDQLTEEFSNHIPRTKNRTNRLFYIRQIGSLPPRFYVSTRYTLQDTFIKHMVKRMQEEFYANGIAVHLVCKSQTH